MTTYTAKLDRFRWSRLRGALSDFNSDHPATITLLRYPMCVEGRIVLRSSAALVIDRLARNNAEPDRVTVHGTAPRCRARTTRYRTTGWRLGLLPLCPRHHQERTR